MLTVRLNKNAILGEVLSGIESGITQAFIVKTESNKSLDRIVAYASSLQSEGNRVFIEVQFQSKYSSRPKRLEIVEYTPCSINLYKFSSAKKFDIDAIELDKVANEICEKHQALAMNIEGYILLDKETKIDFINQSIKDMGLKIRAKIY